MRLAPGNPGDERIKARRQQCPPGRGGDSGTSDALVEHALQVELGGGRVVHGSDSDIPPKGLGIASCDYLGHGLCSTSRLGHRGRLASVTWKKPFKLVLVPDPSLHLADRSSLARTLVIVRHACLIISLGASVAPLFHHLNGHDPRANTRRENRLWERRAAPSAGKR